MKSFQSAFVDAKNDSEKAKLYYNIGNSLLKSQKIKESVGAYKESLKLNPTDEQAKYNLSYALNMLKNPNQDQQQNQNQDQNKDQQDQNKDQQDQNQQNQESTATRSTTTESATAAISGAKRARANQTRS